MLTLQLNQSHFILNKRNSSCLINRRNRVYKQLKRSPTNSSLACSLKLFKKQVKVQILRDSKFELDREIKDTCLWSAVKKLYPVPKTIKSTANFSADEINDFYVSISMPQNSCNSDDTPLPTPPLPIQSQLIRTPYFTFNEINSLTLLNSWKSLKNPLSSTLDTLEISPKMVDLCLKSTSFVSHLTSFFNLCISSGVIPNELKCSKVIPIPKISNACEPNDFRPISIQPVILKLFEKCVVPQLVSHLESNNLLCPQQFGFRKFHSTQHALIKVTDYNYNALKRNHVCIMIVLDFKKAFDKVDKTVLSHKLQWYNINPTLINSLLTDREQCVCLNCGNKIQTSKRLRLYLGVPQGACISCFLFNIMINDLPYLLKICDPNLFADDSTLLASCDLHDLSDTLAKIEIDLMRIDNWLKENTLQMNYDTLCFLTLGNFKHVNVADIKLSMNGCLLKRAEQVKVLGCIIDDKLNWHKQANNVSKKCHLALSPLYPLRNILSFNSKLLIVNSIVLSL